MSSIVLERINKQLNNFNQKSTPDSNIEQIQKQEIKIELSPAISPEKLRKIFMSELNKPEVHKLPQNTLYMKFDGVESFVNWYLPLKDKFSEEQNIAMSTLIQARDIINVGCGCKRKNRLEQANNYFKTFWEKNSQTDLPNKIISVGNFNSISFAVNDQIFLNLSIDTPQNVE